MIKGDTVLVLGAGASHPYGFPLGVQLVDQICKEVLDQRQDIELPDLEKLALRRHPGKLAARLEQKRAEAGTLMERLVGLGHKANSISTFARKLHDSRVLSVDVFLRLNTEYKDVGKAAIADVLLRAEASSTPPPPEDDDDWYRFLISEVLLKHGPEAFGEQARKLTVLTFNFERSFEYTLVQSMRALYGPKQATALLPALRIHHMHGVLGETDFMADSRGVTSYGPTGDDLMTATRSATNQIKIVDDEIDEALIAAAATALGKATYVYFVGFGFEERNLQKLSLPESVNRRAVVRGTSFKLSGPRRAEILAYFGGLGTIALSPVKAREFLSEIETF